MAEQNRGELRIDGSGTSSGGTFDTIKINGSGKITGDVECSSFQINGSGHILGAVKADDGKINGSGTIDGAVKAKNLKISGSAKIKGTLSGDSLKAEGSANFGGDLNVSQIKISGSVKIGGDCTAESFESEGAFEIGGLLNSDEIVIRLYHARSKAREIGGSNIQVIAGPSAGFNIIKSILTLGAFQSELDADLIEGDVIELENTVAKVVRGDKVSIGRGCQVGLVEYRDSLHKSNDARVEKETKI